MRPVLALAAAVVSDALRRKVIWLVVAFAGLLGFVAPSLPSYGTGVIDAVFREVSIALMFTAALVVTVALAATRVPAEVERRTVYGVLTRDIRRWHYLLGTWLGIWLVTGAVIAATTVVTLVIGGVSYGSLMIIVAAASVAVWLEAGVVAAFGILLSTRVGAVTTATGMLAFLFVGHSAGSLLTLEAGVRAPWWFPSLELFDVVAAVAHGSGYPPVYAAAMLAAFAGWVGLLLFGAAALYEARDL